MRRGRSSRHRRPRRGELVRDFLLDQRLRRDVFDRGNRRLDAEERARRLLASSYALARPAAAICYSITTSAGECAYDNPTARAIVGALAAGPRPLTSSSAMPDLLETLLTLCAAGDAMPVEPGRAPVDALNCAIWRRLGGPDEIGWLALPCGTALEADRESARRPARRWADRRAALARLARLPRRVRSLVSVAHRGQIGAGRLVVEADRHQGHLMHQPQPVLETPAKQLAVARRQQKPAASKPVAAPISAIRPWLVSATAWPKKAISLA